MSNQSQFLLIEKECSLLNRKRVTKKMGLRQKGKFSDYRVSNALGVTLLRKDRINSDSDANSFPHHLDAKKLLLMILNVGQKIGN